VHNLLMSHALLNLALAGAVAVVLSPYVFLVCQIIGRLRRAKKQVERIKSF
jgi:hypothetical protein